MIHRKTHPNLDVEGCYGCKLASFRVAPSATPSRNEGQFAADNVAKEQRWQTDHAAYRRLVKDGMQPHTLDGASELERYARDKVEVEHGLGAPIELGETA
jgi:hypothetical protein